MQDDSDSQEDDRGVGQPALTVLAVVIVMGASLAGAIVVSELTDPTPEPYEAVPEEADIVVSVDPVGFAEDPVTTSAGDEVLAATDANQSYQQLLSSAFEDANAELNTSLSNYSVSDVGLEVQDIGEIVVFADSEAIQQTSPLTASGTTAGSETDERDQPPYVGAVIELDLSGEDVGDIFSALQRDGDGGESSAEVNTYKGRQILLFDGGDGEQPAAVANLGPGLLGVGTPRVARDIVDTHVGDAEGIPEWMKPTVGGERYLGVAVANPTEFDTQNRTRQAPDGAEYRYVTLAYGTVDGEQARLKAEFGMEINGTLAASSVELRADSPMIDFFIGGAVGGFVNGLAARPIATPTTRPIETGNRTRVPD